MKKGKKILISVTTISLLFGGSLLQSSVINLPPCLSGSQAWAENQSDYLDGKDVEAWESFRGWSTRVPYGQSSETPASEEQVSKKETEDSDAQNKKTEDSKTGTSSTTVQDDVKPWESFRGWSRPIPYNRNY